MLDEDEGDEDDDDELDDIVGDDDDSVVVALTAAEAVAAVAAAADLPFSSIRFVDMELFRELFWLFDEGGVLGPLLLIAGVRVAAELVVAFPPPVVRSDVLESEFNDVDDVLA